LPEESTSPGVRSRLRRRRRKPQPTDEVVPKDDAHGRTMLVSVDDERSQIAILDGRELVEHYVARKEDSSIVGNIYLGKVQNVLPGMEAAFINIGVERNAVIYVGEVGFDEELEEGEPRRIEKILKTGQSILAQVTKDPTARVWADNSYRRGRSRRGRTGPRCSSARTTLVRHTEQVQEIQASCPDT
jgi:hypothetical protein